MDHQIPTRKTATEARLVPRAAAQNVSGYPVEFKFADRLYATTFTTPRRTTNSRTADENAML
jgi:hypothetical protein